MPGKMEDMARIHVTARKLGREYASAYPLADGGTVGPDQMEALTLAGERAADGHMQAQQARVTRGREAFTEVFSDGAMEVWKPRPAYREMGIGDIGIAAVRFFGRWRVQVYRVARTDQENILEGTPADNWQELEAEARGLMLARYGTIETLSYGLVCPGPLADRARWQNWAKKNTAQEGK